jgi:hypothetical protein
MTGSVPYESVTSDHYGSLLSTSRSIRKPAASTMSMTGFREATASFHVSSKPIVSVIKIIERKIREIFKRTYVVFFVSTFSVWFLSDAEGWVLFERMIRSCQFSSGTNQDPTHIKTLSMRGMRSGANVEALRPQQ